LSLEKTCWRAPEEVNCVKVYAGREGQARSGESCLLQHHGLESPLVPG